MLTVGVKNGYDEVNIQISAKYKYECLSATNRAQSKECRDICSRDKTLFKHKLSRGNGNISKPATDRFGYDDQNTDKPSSVTTQLPNMHTVRALRSDRARVPLGRYTATELEPSSVATQRLSSVCFVRSLRGDRTLPKRRYDTNPCILVYPSMLSPEDRSEPISCFQPFEVINQSLR